MEARVTGGSRADMGEPWLSLGHPFPLSPCCGEGVVPVPFHEKVALFPSIPCVSASDHITTLPRETRPGACPYHGIGALLTPACACVHGTLPRGTGGRRGRVPGGGASRRVLQEEAHGIVRHAQTPPMGRGELLGPPF